MATPFSSDNERPYDVALTVGGSDTPSADVLPISDARNTVIPAPSAAAPALFDWDVQDSTSGIWYRVQLPEGISQAEKVRRANEQIAQQKATPIDKPEGAPDPLTPAQKIVRQTAPSVIGGHIGGVIGAPLGPVGVVVGEMAGSGLGELANQTILSPWTGAQWSPLDTVLATAMPLGLRAAGKLITGTGRIFTATEGRAVVRQFTNSADDVNKVMSSLNAATRNAPSHSREGLRSAIEALAPEERMVVEKSLAEIGSPRLLSNVTSTVKPGAYAPLDEVLNHASAIEERLRPLIMRNGPESKPALKVYSALWDDLEKAAANVVGVDGPKVRAVVESMKQRAAADMLSEMAEGAYRGAKGVDLNTAIGVAKAVTTHREFFERTLGKEAVAEMTDILTNPAMASNWDRILQTIIKGAVSGGKGAAGGALIDLATGTPGLSTGVGAVLGLGAPQAMRMLRALSDAVVTPAGRRAIKAAMASPVADAARTLLDPNLLAQGARTTMGPVTRGAVPNLRPMQVNPQNLTGPQLSPQQMMAERNRQLLSTPSAPTPQGLPLAPQRGLPMTPDEARRRRLIR